MIREGLFNSFFLYTKIIAVCVHRLLLGLNPHTTTRQITLAAYEAICFQTRDLLESLAKDLPTWPKLEKLTVGGGELIEKPFLLQLLADICGITIERPQTAAPSCLGAMLATGAAMKVLTLDNCMNMLQPPSDLFQPTMCATRKDLLRVFQIKKKNRYYNCHLFPLPVERNSKYRRWKRAIKKCLNWDTFDLNDSDSSNDYDDRGTMRTSEMYLTAIFNRILYL